MESGRLLFNLAQHFSEQTVKSLVRVQLKFGSIFIVSEVLVSARSGGVPGRLAKAVPHTLLPELSK